MLCFDIYGIGGACRYDRRAVVAARAGGVAGPRGCRATGEGIAAAGDGWALVAAGSGRGDFRLGALAGGASLLLVAARALRTTEA